MSKQYEVTLRGLSPYLMSAFSAEAEEGLPGGSKKSRTRSAEFADENQSRRASAEKLAYRLPNGKLYIPAVQVLAALRNAGSERKMRGSRKSLKFVIAGAVRVLDEVGRLEPETDFFEVDSRSAVNQKTKGRILVHRPRLDSWQVTVGLEIDDDIVAPEDVLDTLVSAGRRYGIGSWRPEKTGPFGRFQVTCFEEVGSTEEIPQIKITVRSKPKGAKRAA